MMRQNPTKANAAFTGIDVQRMVLRTGPFDGEQNGTASTSLLRTALF